LPRIAQTAWRLAKEPDPPGAKIELPDFPTAEDQLLPKPAAVPYVPPVRYKLQHHQIARGTSGYQRLARNPAYPFLACQLFGSLDPGFGER